MWVLNWEDVVIMNSNTFVCELSKENQNKIKEVVKLYLVKEGYNDEEIKESISNAMEDRLCILQDIIDIKQFLS